MDFCYKIFLVQLGEKKGYNVRKKRKIKGRKGRREEEGGKKTGKEEEVMKKSSLLHTKVPSKKMYTHAHSSCLHCQ